MVSEQVDSLVIVHWSSLDSYAYHCDSFAAEMLAQWLTNAADKMNDKPVYVLDQKWDKPCSGRKKYSSTLFDRSNVERIYHDEADPDGPTWTEVADDLNNRLIDYGATKVQLGGLWYTSDHTSGCVVRLYDELINQGWTHNQLLCERNLLAYERQDSKRRTKTKDGLWK